MADDYCKGQPDGVDQTAQQATDCKHITGKHQACHDKGNKQAGGKEDVIEASHHGDLHTSSRAAPHAGTRMQQAKGEPGDDGQDEQHAQAAKDMGGSGPIVDIKGDLGDKDHRRKGHQEAKRLPAQQADHRLGPEKETCDYADGAQQHHDAAQAEQP